MRFEADEFDQVRDAFLGSQGDDIIEFMYRRSTGASTDDFDKGIVDIALSMGWMTVDGHLTSKGYCVSASCREYLYWLERDRKLPFEAAVPWLNPTYFKDRTVLEIGCGMGANIMSLHGHAIAIGIEPVEVYKQMGTILRQKIGWPEPEIVLADGENLPIERGSVDVVLVVTSHQYFDVVAVFAEIARILKPGGEVFIVGYTLPEYLSTLKSMRINFRQFKDAFITLLNTASYSIARKRIIPVRKGGNTSRPIYPTAARLRYWMGSVGIAPDPDKVQVGSDCFQRGIKLPTA